MNGGERGIDRLLSVVSRLRGEQGCPWDREQTLDSLKQYLVEECYELIDAIDGGAVRPVLWVGAASCRVDFCQRRA